MDTLLLIALVVGIWVLIFRLRPTAYVEPQRIEVIIPPPRRSAFAGCLGWFIWSVLIGLGIWLAFF